MKMVSQEWLDPLFLPSKRSSVATAWPKPVRFSSLSSRFSILSHNLKSLTLQTLPLDLACSEWTGSNAWQKYNLKHRTPNPDPNGPRWVPQTLWSSVQTLLADLCFPLVKDHKTGNRTPHRVRPLKQDLTSYKVIWRFYHFWSPSLFSSKNRAKKSSLSRQLHTDSGRGWQVSPKWSKNIYLKRIKSNLTPWFQHLHSAQTATANSHLLTPRRMIMTRGWMGLKKNRKKT